MGESMADAVFIPALMFGGVVIAVVGVCLTMVAIGASEWARTHLRAEKLRSGAGGLRAALAADRLAVLRRRISGLRAHDGAVTVLGLLQVRAHRRGSRGRLTQLFG